MNKPALPTLDLQCEPSEAPRETAISTAFSVFLPILADYVRAERDLEDIGYSMDPAYAAWNEASDHAQDRLIDVLRLLRDLPLEIPEDLSLQRAALAVHAMRYEGGPAARRRHQRMEEVFERTYLLPGTSPTALHRNLLMTWARPLIACLIALPIFDTAGEEANGEDIAGGSAPFP